MRSNAKRIAALTLAVMMSLCALPGLAGEYSSGILNVKDKVKQPTSAPTEVVEEPTQPEMDKEIEAAKPTPAPTEAPAETPYVFSAWSGWITASEASHYVATVCDSPNGNLVGQIRRGEPVNVVEESNGWVRIEGAVSGWVMNRYVTDVEPEEIKPEATEEPIVEPTEPEVTEEPVEEPTEPEVTEEPVEEPIEPEVTEEPVEETIEPEVTEEPVEEPIEPEATEEPVEEPTEPEVTEEPVEEPTEPEVTEEPVEEPTEPEATEEPVEEPVEEPTEPEETEEPVEEPTEPEVTEEPVEEPTEPEATEEPVEEPTEPEVTEEPVEEPTEPEETEEPVEEPTEPEVTEEPVEEPTEPEVTEELAEEATDGLEETAELEAIEEPIKLVANNAAVEVIINGKGEEIQVVTFDPIENVNVGGEVNVRLAADGLSEITMTLAADAAVTILGVEGDWVKVSLDGAIGYIYIDDIAVINEIEGALPEKPEIDSNVLLPVKVTLFSSRRSVMEPGETVIITSKLENTEGYELRFQWSVDKGNGFEAIAGANSDSISFEASIETLAYDWELTVYYRPLVTE